MKQVRSKYLPRLHLIANHLENQKEPAMICEKLPSGIALIKLNKPKKLNAVNEDFTKAMNEILLDLQQDDSVYVAIFTGGPKVFIAGADVQSIYGKTTAMALRYFLGEELSKLLRNFLKPVIAAVNGICFGGGLELALNCDIIIANNKAQFALPEIKLSLLPGASGTQRVTRIAPKGISSHAIFTGDVISAEQAFELKIVTQLTERDALLDAIELAQRILQNPFRSVQYAKILINAQYEIIGNYPSFQKTIANLAATDDETQSRIRNYINSLKPKN